MRAGQVLKMIWDDFSKKTDYNEINYECNFIMILLTKMNNYGVGAAFEPIDSTKPGEKRIDQVANLMKKTRIEQYSTEENKKIFLFFNKVMKLREKEDWDNQEFLIEKFALRDELALYKKECLESFVLELLFLGCDPDGRFKKKYRLKTLFSTKAK